MAELPKQMKSSPRNNDNQRRFDLERGATREDHSPPITPSPRKGSHFAVSHYFRAIARGRAILCSMRKHRHVPRQSDWCSRRKQTQYPKRKVNICITQFSSHLQ
jgi:hypothetical protein